MRRYSSARAMRHKWERQSRVEPRGHAGKLAKLYGWVCQVCGREVMTRRYRPDEPTYRQKDERGIRQCDVELLGAIHET